MASLLERIYAASPVWGQQAMVAAYGWWWYQRRFNSAFHRLVAEFESRERWTQEQFHAYQESRLRELLRAAQRSDYYREVFRECGISADLAPFDALARLPILTKETLRRRPDDLLTTRPVPRRTIVFKSSGTTGTPSCIYYTPEFHAMEMAAPEARNLRWAGVTYRHRRAMFGVRKVSPIGQTQPPFWRFSPAEQLAYASIYHLSPKNLPAYVAFLRSFRPSMVMGYPSALHTIAQYALATGDMPSPADAVFTMSETLTEQARARIEAAWQCKVFDRYGAVEGCLLVTQCAHGRYHVSPDVGIVEIVRDDGSPAAPGELGSVVCTGLHNTLQPMIRYNLGDVARWALDQHCPCGRAMPILESIEGRFEDMCYTAHGEFLRFDTVFKGVDHIREAQVVQEAVDRFSVVVAATDAFGKQQVALLQRNLRIHVGDVHVQVKVVDRIERLPSGKFKAVVCRLTPEEKARFRADRGSGA